MSRQLTVTINNIPDHVLNQAWKDCKEDGKKMLGVMPIKETENIQIDFDELADNYQFLHERLSELLASSLTCYVVMEAHTFLNQKEGK